MGLWRDIPGRQMDSHSLPFWEPVTWYVTHSTENIRLRFGLPRSPMISPSKRWPLPTAGSLVTISKCMLIGQKRRAYFLLHVNGALIRSLPIHSVDTHRLGLGFAGIKFARLLDTEMGQGNWPNTKLEPRDSGGWCRCGRDDDEAGGRL